MNIQKRWPYVEKATYPSYQTQGIMCRSLQIITIGLMGCWMSTQSTLGGTILLRTNEEASTEATLLHSYGVILMKYNLLPKQE